MTSERNPSINYNVEGDMLEVLWENTNYYVVKEFNGLPLNSFSLLLSEETNKPVGIFIYRLHSLIKEHKDFIKECENKEDKYAHCKTIKEYIHEAAKDMPPFRAAAYYSEVGDSEKPITNYFEAYWANVAYYCSGSYIFAGKELCNGLEVFRDMGTKDIVGVRIYEALNV